MAAPNRLNFAVVREDPELELELIDQRSLKRALVVASGGCTALSLVALRSSLGVTAFDFNPAQLIHVQWKAAAAEQGAREKLNVGSPDHRGLNQRGAFEGLFRVVRSMVVDFVARGDELETFFFAERDDAAARLARAERWFTSPYWPVVFELAFHDRLLVTMFGPGALQHAEPGSYPGYFQRAFERGLRHPDASHNPFLQHVLLGQYLPGDAPAYALAGRGLPLRLLQGTLLDVPDLETYDLFSLSNVFDWSDDALVASWASRLKERARPGAVVLLRQLNNTRDLERFFAPEFAFDAALGERLRERDRSLFYNRVLVGVRQ